MHRMHNSKITLLTFAVAVSSSIATPNEQAARALTPPTTDVTAYLRAFAGRAVAFGASGARAGFSTSLPS
ncbi:hypothetical protein EVAR_12811_1 [Eumeta japonica]|uniref:Uncharacterized protein n=1 Tax=Eumeta variegata TaxID=151549 RepID=A0A4C1UBL7_EUMVA|nr:hypothetical protein EVAR_12811_1 [Eumeta japonica]